MSKTQGAVEATARPGPPIEELLMADTRPLPLLLEESRNDFTSCDADHIDIDRFISPEFYKLEVDQMWSRVWQIACHEDQIQNVGDYVVYEIAGRSLIVARTAPDTVKAYHNACLHKGRMLCEGDGHATNFRCKFHGFMWRLDGGLGFVPSRWDFPQVKDEDFRLPEAKVERWSGFVFINLDPDAGPLEDYLADLPDHFKDWRFQNRRLVGHVGQVIRANWKVCVEAFLEFFHGMATHPQVMASSSDVNTRYVVREDRPHYAYMVIPQGVASPWVAHKVDGQMTLDTLFESLAVEGTEDQRALPPGRNVRDYWAELARTRMENSTGRDFSTVSDTEMIDVRVYALFPNIALWGGYTAPFWFRFRPWRNDPEMALMEIFIMPELPEGAPRPPAPKMTLLGPDQKFSDAPELKGVGEFFDQDLGNLEWVQKGLRVSQKREVTMACYQESENRQFHSTLDAYISGKGPPRPGDRTRR